jgi:excinuclease ABC subunit C
MQRMWVEMAEQNARLAITAHRSALSRQGTSGLRPSAGGLDSRSRQAKEARIECFDISHTRAKRRSPPAWFIRATACAKSEYRRFNIRDIQPGDDYAAMRQAVQRRYEKAATGEGVAPDLILIDGGKGQVGAAASALAELGLEHLPMIGVAKGEARKPGLETLIFADGREPLQLPPEHPALHLIQEVRDEAHRFAVTGHRARASKTGRTSRWKRSAASGRSGARPDLAFWRPAGHPNAGIDQLTAVPGISRELAEKFTRFALMPLNIPILPDLAADHPDPAADRRLLPAEAGWAAASGATSRRR